MSTTTISHILSPYKLTESLASRTRQLSCLELIESYFEQGMTVPSEVDLGGCMGYEWRARIAELPDALIHSLSQHIIPALKGCRLQAGDAASSYGEMRQFVDRAQGVIEYCEGQKKTIVKAFRQRPSKKTQVDALVSAQSLLRDMVMLLEDMHCVAVKCEERACEQTLPTV
ncbi:hypothetical protein [Planktotalea arctica]|uniref:hypothetical protein n=1 Tax=Planktotalea arctica TaxID=1481893 RepID=UPI00111BF4E4|nr:hypothetical protein [Planktotalea arctica]